MDTPSHQQPTRLPFNFLSLDLEVGVRDRRIRAFAGLRPDNVRTLIYPASGGNLRAALDRLDNLADGAEFILGHNLVDFDLPHLKAFNPNLRLLRMPPVDTLMLNPLAFPRNPYHHLVKHYQDGQLRRGRINNPELDARLTVEVLSNQWKTLGEAPPDLLTAWHWLTTADGGEGFDIFFSSLRRSAGPPDADAYSAIRTRLNGVACRGQAQIVTSNAAQHGWDLAYALAWLSVSGGNSVMPPWVRHQFPDAGLLVRRLRDTPCREDDCDWCRERHDVRRELTRWFGFDDFRPEPADEAGSPIQPTRSRRPWGAA